MPNYFADYDTTVHFISEAELLRDHQGILMEGLYKKREQPDSNKKTNM